MKKAEPIDNSTATPISAKSILTQEPKTQDYSQLGHTLPIGNLKAYPGTDGFDYYEIGRIASGVNSEVTFGVSIRIWLVQASPNTQLSFRVRVGNATKNVNGKDVIAVVTKADFDSLEMNDCFNDDPKSAGSGPVKQHRSISGSINCSINGGNTNDLIQALCACGYLPNLHASLQTIMPSAGFITEEEFLEYTARMIRNALSHVAPPASEVTGSLNFGDYKSPVLKIINGKPVTMNGQPTSTAKPATASKTALHGDIGL